MDRDTFNASVKKILQNLSSEKLVLFSWRCALYALPFIGCSPHLNFWDDKQLFSVFYAVDISNVNVRGVLNRTSAAADDAAADARNAANVADVTANIADIAADAAANARNAVDARNAADAANVSDAFAYQAIAKAVAANIATKVANTSNIILSNNKFNSDDFFFTITH